MTKYTAKTFPNKDVSQVILQAVRELAAIMILQWSSDHQLSFPKDAPKGQGVADLVQGPF